MCLYKDNGSSDPRECKTEVPGEAFSLLNDLCSTNASRIDATWAEHIHQRWRDSTKQGVSIPYREEDEEELRKGYASFSKLVKKIDKQVSQLEKKNQERNAVKVRQIKGFRSYVLHIGMQLLPGVDDDNSLRTVEDIDELNTVFTKLFSTKNSKSKSKKSDEEKMKVIQVDIQEVASNDHDPSSVFVDLLFELPFSLEWHEPALASRCYQKYFQNSIIGTERYCHFNHARCHYSKPKFR